MLAVKMKYAFPKPTPEEKEEELQAQITKESEIEAQIAEKKEDDGKKGPTLEELEEQLEELGYLFVPSRKVSFASLSPFQVVLDQNHASNVVDEKPSRTFDLWKFRESVTSFTGWSFLNGLFRFG